MSTRRFPEDASPSAHSPRRRSRLELAGIPLAGGTLDVSLRHGDLTVDTHATDLDVIIEGP